MGQRETEVGVADEVTFGYGIGALSVVDEATLIGSPFIVTRGNRPVRRCQWWGHDARRGSGSEARRSPRRNAVRDDVNWDCYLCAWTWRAMTVPALVQCAGAFLWLPLVWL